MFVILLIKTLKNRIKNFISEWDIKYKIDKIMI